jgi:hypothetical protein
MPDSVPGKLLAAIKNRKFGVASKLFATPIDFEAWTPAGHWTADDAGTIAKILEVWFSPGAGNTVTYSNETAGKGGLATLEYEIAWKIQPDDQLRMLRQTYVMVVKGEKITWARVYCAGLHTEFPDVDLEKQRRSKGLALAKPPAPRAVIAKAS